MITRRDGSRKGILDVDWKGRTMSMKVAAKADNTPSHSETCWQGLGEHDWQQFNQSKSCA